MAVRTHLDQRTRTASPGPVAGCEGYLQTGGWWVHLRTCQICGKVGCVRRVLKLPSGG
jgi:hypothetical protein